MQPIFRMLIPFLLVTLTFGLANLAAQTPANEAKQAMAPGSAPPAMYRQAKPQPAPPGAVEEMAGLRGAPTIILPPLDNDALVAQDERERREADGPQALRYSIGRELDVTGANGSWESLAGERQDWSIAIVSTGAFETRLHFTGVDMPEGARLWVYSPLDEPNNWWSFELHGPLGTGDFWSPPTAGERVVVEYVVPTAAEDTPSVVFTIDSIQHAYRDIRSTGRIRDDLSCMADSACWSPWDTVRNAVAKVSIVDGGMGYICSGQLLDTVAGDFTPYFSTANHCIGTQTVAETLSARFFYQTETCGGGLADSRTSNYSDLISTYAPADSTLVMIKGVLNYDNPPGMQWSGWTTSIPAFNDALVGIHHPDGDFKRISFGRYLGTTQANIGGILRRVHTVLWGTPPPPGGPVSVVAPGSSGSGLWVDASELLIGILSGGGSSCATPSNYDYYGRFDWAWSYAPGWSTALQAGPDDDLEDNDSCASASLVADGTYAGRVVKLLDDDWYAFTLDHGEELDLNLSFISLYGDVDVKLYDACGGNLVDFSTTGTSGELINYYNDGAPGTFYAHVYLSNDTRNEYDMSVTRTLNDCNGNGLADDCDLDCGAPGTPCYGLPGCGQSFDCNSTGIPDDCETDCNSDGLADECAIIAHPDDFTGCPGQTAEFQVAASDPSYTFQWIGPSGPLSDGGRISGATTDTLTISDLQPADAGNYRCQILDGCVLTESNPATLSVILLGEITTQPASPVYGCLDSTAVLSIAVTGASPEPSYHWYRNGDPLSNDAKYNGVTTNQLRVVNLDYADSDDTFTCVISNACDSAVSDPGSVAVASPRIILQPENACGEVGGTVVLTTQATAPLPVTMQWRKGSTVVGSGDMLVLDNLQTSDAGDYRALAFTTSPVCITYTDYATVTVATSSTCWNATPGDMDEDGDYDLKDMQQFMMCFGADVTSDLCCSCANVNDADDVVDIADWTALEPLVGGPQ